MSYPNIPDVTPTINIEREDVVNLILASIAFEELGLSHIINSEAEKIQYVLGTIHRDSMPVPPTLNDLLKLDSSVRKMLQDICKKEIILGYKLEEAASITTLTTTTTTSTTTTSTTFTFSTSTNVP